MNEAFFSWLDGIRPILRIRSFLDDETILTRLSPEGEKHDDDVREVIERRDVHLAGETTYVELILPRDEVSARNDKTWTDSLSRSSEMFVDVENDKNGGEVFSSMSKRSVPFFRLDPDVGFVFARPWRVPTGDWDRRRYEIRATLFVTENNTRENSEMIVDGKEGRELETRVLERFMREARPAFRVPRSRRLTIARTITVENPLSLSVTHDYSSILISIENEHDESVVFVRDVTVEMRSANADAKMPNALFRAHVPSPIRIEPSEVYVIRIPVSCPVDGKSLSSAWNATAHVMWTLIRGNNDRTNAMAFEVARLDFTPGTK